VTDDPAAVGSECETLSIAVDDPTDNTVTVTLDRPDARNVLSQELRGDLKRILSAIEDSSLRVVVLTGSDDSGAFASGADLTELADRTALEQRDLSKRPRIYERLVDLDQPVIGRINGLALGGGCELALACDVRLADTRSKFGFPEVSLGLIPGGGGTQRLTSLVGVGQAKRLVLSGAIIGAEEADDIGLIEAVHEPDDLDDAVEDLAGEMAQHSPVALELAKEAVGASTQLGIEDGIEYEAELFAQALASEDAAEGINAFIQDHEPEWTGR
jgi:enoyl-CoA hydratase